MKIPLFLDVYVFEVQRQRGSANSFNYSSCPPQTTVVPLNRAFLDEHAKQHPILGCHNQKKTHGLRGQRALVSSGFTCSWLDPTLAFSLQCNHLLKLLTNLTVDVMWSYIALGPQEGVLQCHETTRGSTWHRELPHLHTVCEMPKAGPVIVWALVLTVGFWNRTAFPFRWSDCYFEFCSL